MEYKYLLGLLCAGMHEEFYDEIRNTLIPFLNPQQYGRSILENSSFIVSSAHPDKALLGRGFVARLSGSTAEFLHMWLIMNAGLNPFYLDEKNRLNLKLEPILPKWLFDKDRTYSFKFLGRTIVTYRNPKRKNTYGNVKCAVKSMRVFLKDRKMPLVINQDTIPSPYAEMVRSGKADKIDIDLG
ncbi:MAG TPA: hypothetical protein ENN78_02705 [Candidatus Omnitrophica bacterium]|nr:hypothetical protein [Candidatus Omnitrophota bacterium]